MREQALIVAGSGRVADAVARMFGLRAVERLLLTLRAQGFESVSVAGPRDLFPASPEGLRFTDVEAEVDAVRDHAKKTAADTALLVVPADAVIHPRLPSVLRERSAQAGTSLVVAGAGPPVMYLRPDDVARLPAAEDLAALAETLLAEQVCDPFDLPSGFFVEAAADGEQRSRAEKALLSTNWRPYDGIVAAKINKHISVRISARIAESFITPNQMTSLAFAFGLTGVALAAFGSHLMFFLGALLLQTQSVLDGCDGELARMRFQASRFGAWYDTVVDDVLGILWVGALGVGAWQATGHLAYLAVGCVAAAMYLLSTSLVYYALLRGGAESHAEFKWWFEEGHDPQRESPDPRAISTWLKFAIRRDFYVLFFFVLAIFGQIEAALVAGAAGATGWFVATMIQISRRGLRLPE